MSDDTTDNTDTETEKRVHLLVRRETHTMLEETRVVLRRSSLASLPPSVAPILDRDWTSDVLVKAGCAAIQVLLQPRESDRYGKKAEAHIAYIQETGGYPPSAAGRAKAIDDIIGGAAVALHNAEQQAAASEKPAVKKGSNKR